jgi:hypothetical protein
MDARKPKIPLHRCGGGVDPRGPRSEPVLVVIAPAIGLPLRGEATRVPIRVQGLEDEVSGHRHGGGRIHDVPGPGPNRPRSEKPQQYTAPPLVRAQVWFPPDATST